MFREEDIILRADHITKEFPASGGRKVRACDDVSLCVYKGKTLGVAGESGCGKSTFARVLMQLETAEQGAILYHGRDLNKLSRAEQRENRQKIQMVFQDPMASFNPKMRVVDILTEPLLNFKRIAKKDKRDVAAKLLKMVELPEDFMDRFPHSMSGGQRQRIGIARALSLNPEILVCDEATAALDVSIQETIIELLMKLQREQGISIVFICHDIALIQSISHQMAVMYLGSVVEVIPGDKIKAEAAHPYTKALLGSLFSVKMDRDKKIEVLEGDVPSPLDIPQGCPFQDRCPQCQALCKTEKPALKDVGEGHQVACHFA